MSVGKRIKSYTVVPYDKKKQQDKIRRYGKKK